MKTEQRSLKADTDFIALEENLSATASFTKGKKRKTKSGH